nr:hypothetical protein KPHV_60960 [Kitasatospora purpeofusca]
MPKVTTSHLRQLLDSRAEQPVLYIDPESGQLDIWADALVHHASVVLTREELVDALGDDFSDGDADDYLAIVQDAADEAASAG